MQLSTAQHKFRERYRAQISPGYQPARHILWVFGTGLVVLGYASATLVAVQPLEWLVVPLTLIGGNFGEYATHRWLGHRRHGAANTFYRRHTVEHHGFFSHAALQIEHWRDLRLVLFPVWLIFVIVLVGILPAAYLLNALWSANAAALFALAALGAYLLYEFMHLCFHLPDTNALTRLPGVRAMRHRHRDHHDPVHMGKHNFNLTWPLFDWVLGTGAPRQVRASE